MINYFLFFFAKLIPTKPFFTRYSFVCISDWVGLYVVLPRILLTLVKPVLIAGLKTLNSKSAKGFANRADAPATVAIAAVVDATWALGKYCSITPISSYNTTQISFLGFAGSFCNSYPDTFSSVSYTHLTLPTNREV